MSLQSTSPTLSVKSERRSDIAQAETVDMINNEDTEDIAQPEIVEMVNNEDTEDVQSHNSDQSDTDDDDAASETSTVAYEHVGHESFETFQHKVTQLAKDTFPKASSIVIEHMKGGSNNRVFGLTVTTPTTKKYTPRWITRFFRLSTAKKLGYSHKYILRVPRFDVDGRLERQVATLNVVASLLPSFHTPQVIKYDVTKNNVLEKQYMIQKRLPGQSLARIGDDLSLEQWKCVAKCVTEIMAGIAACTSESAGEIAVDNPARPISSSGVKLDKFCVPRGPTSESFGKPNTWPAQSQSSLSFMLEQCERWREYQKSEGYCWEHVWDGFSVISESLQKREFLDGPFGLTHGDLEGYNLLVDVKDSTNVEITGILDWDSAVFGPKFMSHRAPFWLWLDKDVDSDDADDEENANVEPQEERERELKRVFETEASEDFKKFAFQPQAILARRMFAILKDGMFSDYVVKEAEVIIQEWSQLHPEDNVVVIMSEEQ
jgi:aminoglycoside phosphotransferase (APT) family kinase protein